ncbi:TonB-dependent receptor [Flavisphingomonas formosensis]|uniref:TonB-dependent receptor n=1 Tax=Flavisphingomonas formosensis TaxID=861534 RepID=UPI001E286DDC|nr:TonB-dependent receptor [Sphingomonas formosensis]
MGAIDEIVVTATRQALPLARVPLSVSAYSQQSMDERGVKSIADIARFTPGVAYQQDGNNVAIRGIASAAGAGTTGIYIDDTPIQVRTLGFDSDNALPVIFDLERVEVLRGPQGTLFGAGSEGGTVRYITPAPSLNNWHGYARAEIAGIQHGGLNYEGGAAIGGPIIRDKLGFRISAWHRRDGGYVDHVDNATGAITSRNTNSSDVTVIHAALGWQPTSELSITPSVHFQRRVQNDSGIFWPGISDPGKGVFKIGTPELQHMPDRFWLPSLKIEYDLGGVQLISNTSWFRRDNLSGYDATVLNLTFYQSLLPADSPPLLTSTGINKALPFYAAQGLVTNKQRNFTQEVRLQSSNPNARVNWTVGFFYQVNRQRSEEHLRDPMANDIFPLLFGTSIEDYFGAPLYQGVDSYTNQTHGRDSQIAGYFDIGWRITDTLKINGGLRYARTRFSFSNFADGPQNGGFSSASGATTEHPLTPKVGLTWQPNRNNMLYATWAKGYRVGGASPPVPLDICAQSLVDFGIENPPSSYKSDTVSSFELGTKNRLFGGRLHVEASAFFIRWNNIQQSVLLPSCSIQYTDNLGTVHAKGFDLQASFRPVDGLTLTAAVGYTDARYVTTAHAGSSGSGGIIAAKGDAIEGHPWTLSLGAEYEFGPVERRYYVRADYDYSSRNHWLTPDRDPETEVYDSANVAPSATHFLSARAGVRMGPADVSLFVDNLLDNAPLLSRTRFDTEALLFMQRSWTPRTMGLTVAYRL